MIGLVRRGEEGEGEGEGKREIYMMDRPWWVYGGLGARGWLGWIMRGGEW